MDLTYSPEDLAFRDTTQRWLAGHVPDREPTTLEERRTWHRRLYDAGYVGMGSRRPLPGHRAEDLDERGADRRLGAPPGPDGSPGREAQGDLLLPDLDAPARRRRPAAPPDHRQRPLLRGLPD